MKYKRLTRKDERGFYHYNCTEKDQEDCLIYENCGECYGTNVLYRLAELEDKIEQGTLIELPCKVGDTVFYVSDGGIEEFVVSAIEVIKTKYDSWGTNIIHFDNKETGARKFNYHFYFSWIGKSVFFTREEAEKKLKELNG